MCTNREMVYEYCIPNTCFYLLSTQHVWDKTAVFPWPAFAFTFIHLPEEFIYTNAQMKEDWDWLEKKVKQMRVQIFAQRLSGGSQVVLDLFIYYLRQAAFIFSAMVCCWFFHLLIFSRWDHEASPAKSLINKTLYYKISRTSTQAIKR